MVRPKLSQASENLSTLCCMSASVAALRAQSSACVYICMYMYVYMCIYIGTNKSTESISFYQHVSVLAILKVN